MYIRDLRICSGFLRLSGMLRSGFLRTGKLRSAPCTMEDFVIKDSELGTLSEEDSIQLLETNFPLLQIFIQVLSRSRGNHSY